MVLNLTISELTNKLNVLLIEDNPMDARLISEYFELSKFVDIYLITTDRVSNGLKLISKEDFDIILLDLTLPDATKLEALDRIMAFTTDIPIIILTGMKDEKLAITAVQKGAEDYLVKGSFNRDSLNRALIYAVERNRTRKEIVKNKNFLESTIEAINHPFYVIDPNNYKILLCNSTTKKMFDGKKEDIKCFELTHNELVPCSNNGEKCPVEIVKKTKNSITLEHIHLDKTGDRKVFELHAHPIIDEDGEVTQIIEYTIDITERKIAEERIKASEQQYRTLFEGMPIGLYRTNPKGDVITANKAFLNMIGYDYLNDLSKLNSVTLASDLGYPRERFLEILEKKHEVFGFETSIKRKDGSVIYVRENARAIKNSEGSIIYHEGSIENITDRKRAEDTKRDLKKSEEKFKALFETSRDAITFTSIEGKILDANQAILDMLGFSKDEIITRTFWDFTPKKWEAMESEIIDNQVMKQGYSNVFEKEYIRKDGVIFPVELRVGLLHDDLGKPSQMFSVVRDITSHKQAEQTLRHRTRDLGDRIKEINCLYSVSTATEDPNKSLEEVFLQILALIPLAWQYPEITCARIMYDGKEYTSKIFQDSPWMLISNINVEGVKSGVIEVYYLEEKSGIDEGPFVKEERNLIDAIAAAIGKFIERKKTVDIVSTEQKKLHRILDSMEDGIYIVNTQYEIEFLNSTLRKDFGSINGKKCFEYFHDRTEPCPWCQNEKVFTGETVRWEWTSFKNNKVYDLIDTPLTNLDGSISKLEIFRDITERKFMEEKIRENEEKFRGIFTQAFDAILMIDKTGRIVDVNKAGCLLLGYEKQILVTLTLRDIHPKKEFKKMITLVKRILEGHSSHLGETIFLTRNGTKIHAEGGGATIEIAGEIFIVASFRDITERIRWEEEMKNRLMKFNVEDGNVYLIKEIAPTLSLNVFKDLLNIGYGGHLVSRTPKSDLKTKDAQKFDHYWVANKNKTQDSLFGVIEELIDAKSRRNVILIDRLDYFVLNYGFKETVQFIYRIRELSYLKSLVILISIDPATLDEKELNLLEKETTEIIPRFMVKIPEEMLEVLRYVFKMNNLGVKPSYSEVRDELQISRPTVSKRIKQMLATGYLHEHIKGNRKTLELSQKGRTLFMMQ